MNLKSLNRTQLDLHIKNLAQRERSLLGEVLQAIQEIDARRLYLEMGYANLFTYLTEAVGYSAGSAQRRIDGARLLREIPELGPKICSGAIGLNQVSLLQRAVREVAKNQTGTKTVNVADKRELLSLLENQNHQDSQKTVADFLDLPVLQTQTQKTQADSSVRFELTLTKEFYDQVKYVQELLSHSLPDNSLLSYLKYFTAKTVQQDAGPSKVRKKQASKASASQFEIKDEASFVQDDNADLDEISKPTATAASKSDVATSSDSILATAVVTATAAIVGDPRKSNRISPLPKGLRLQVLKVQNSCQYVDPLMQKKCDSRWHLQVDHRQAIWAGGSHEQINLQTFCANHNQFKYRAEQGIRYKS